MTRKEEMIRALEELPDDADFEDAMDRLLFLYKLQRGIEQADTGELISQIEHCMVEELPVPKSPFRERSS